MRVSISSKFPPVRITIAVIAVMGATLAFYATSLGIGTEVDSATYLMAARDLLAGKGLSLQVAGRAGTAPLTSFPPLLPVALATLGDIGIDPIVAGRWLNVALFGADIFLIASFVRKYTGSDIAAIFSSLLTATTVDVLINHCMLISEPLFLFCVLTGLILIARYIENPTFPLLFGFSAAFAAASAARYIGVSLMPVGVGAILLATRPFRLRRIHLAAYVSVFACPLAVWLARNMILVHTFTNRRVAFHPPAIDRFEASYLSLSTWILPAAVPAFLRIGILTVVLALLLRPLLFRSKTVPENSAKSRLDGLLIAFLCAYLLGFVITQTFFDAQIWITGRHLLLVYVIGTMVVISQTMELLNSAAASFRVVCIGLSIALLSLGALRTGKNVGRMHEDGLGLSSKQWQTSPLITKMKELDDRVPIISNSNAVIYLLTGKLAYALPNRVSPQTDAEYAGKMAWMNNEIQHEGAVIVYFTVFQPPEVRAPAERHFETQLGLRRIATEREGYMLAKL